jgi:hypothetical protein
MDWSISARLLRPLKRCAGGSSNATVAVMAEHDGTGGTSYLRAGVCRAIINDQHFVHVLLDRQHHTPDEPHLIEAGDDGHYQWLVAVAAKRILNS